MEERNVFNKNDDDDNFFLITIVLFTLDAYYVCSLFVIRMLNACFHSLFAICTLDAYATRMQPYL